MITPRVDFHLEGVWTDVTAHVLRRGGIRWNRGIFEQGPMARLARPGSLSLLMNNQPTGQALGYYSPGNANVRPGFRHGIGVRLRLTDGTNTRYVWRGVIRTAAASPGAAGTRDVAIVAVDWMGRFSETDAVNLTLREAVRVDDAMQDLIDQVAEAPAHTDLEVGSDELPFVFDDLGGTVPKCTQVAMDLLSTEQGFLYVRGDADEGETLVLESRTTRALATTVATYTGAEINADSDALSVPADLANILNYVEVATVSRRVDASATTVLISLDSPVRVEAGNPVVMFVDYRDPEHLTAWIGGKDMVAPVANTDWTANSSEDGSGSDLTSVFTVSMEAFGSRAMLTISTTTTGYLRGPGSADGMQVRGRGLYRYAPVSSIGINTASITQHGKRPLPQPLVLPYQGSRLIGQDIADYTAYINGSTLQVPTRVRVLTEKPALYADGINRDIGDRIALTDVVTGLDDVAVFIHGIEQELDADGLLHTAWAIVPADTTDLLIFDTGRFDESAFGWG